MPDPTPPTAPRSRRFGTFVWVAVLLAANALFVSGMLVLVPRLKRTFDEFNLQLPWVTNTTVQFGDLYCRWWFVLAPLQLLLIVGGVIVGRHCFRTSKPGNVVAAVCLFLLVGVMVASAGGLLVSVVKLSEGLSK